MKVWKYAVMVKTPNEIYDWMYITHLGYCSGLSEALWFNDCAFEVEEWCEKRGIKEYKVKKFLVEIIEETVE